MLSSRLQKHPRFASKSHHEIGATAKTSSQVNLLHVHTTSLQPQTEPIQTDSALSVIEMKKLLSVFVPKPASYASTPPPGRDDSGSRYGPGSTPTNRPQSLRSDQVPLLADGQGDNDSISSLNIGDPQFGVRGGASLDEPVPRENVADNGGIDGTIDSSDASKSPKTAEIKERVDTLRAAIQGNGVDEKTRKSIDAELHAFMMVINELNWEEVVITHRDKFLEDLLKTYSEDFLGSFRKCEFAIVFDSKVALCKKWYDEMVARVIKLQSSFQQVDAAKKIEDRVEHYRAAQMYKVGGALHCIQLIPKSNDGTWLTALPHPCQITYATGDWQKAAAYGAQGFVPGELSWWLNLSCAARDGMLRDPYEEVNLSSDGGMCVLVMNGGIVKDDTFDRVTYVRETHEADTISRLLNNHGHPIRIIRGYQLQGSHLAPNGGFRYDGLRKQMPRLMGFRVEVTLTRLPGQTPINEVTRTPRPSQMDEWEIYNKLHFTNDGNTLDKIAPHTPFSSPAKN
ncbi:hypothetical protein HYFRA_00005176 [Hymenoscyphus fraxineus]|uniref:YDG domain-containing protein n=1 Tax=Hymenoscyphus fraxineus TaxID=746836 RepID=A0A9N9LD96_9HELO|nr:hypothetical protein HYFRA_00005176 [Hymenoscyphus fraxineus]